MKEIIDQYNQYCNKNDYKEYIIEYKIFNNSEELSTKLSAELMAGEGPDIISLNSGLPYEKLIEQNAFLDVNQLMESDTSTDAVDINELNQNIMNMGVYDGKRYLVPFFYKPNVLITTRELLENYQISCDKQFYYNNIGSIFREYIVSNDKVSFSNSEELLNSIIYNYINDNLDFCNKEYSFNTDKFKKELSDIRELILKSNDGNIESNSIKENTCLFINNDMLGYSITGISNRYNSLVSSVEAPIILQNIIGENTGGDAYCEAGIAINSKSKFTNEAYCFIKYMLSEKSQSNFCGSKNTIYSSISLPVNLKSFQSIVETANITVFVETEGIDNDFMNSYLEIINDIDKCRLSNNYYNENIINDIVNDYLDEKVDTDKFIEQLISKTKLYMEE